MFHPETKMLENTGKHFWIGMTQDEFDGIDWKKGLDIVLGGPSGLTSCPALAVDFRDRTVLAEIGNGISWVPCASIVAGDDLDQPRKELKGEQSYRRSLMVADWEIVACGCRTKEQLRRWFARVEYDRLLKLGYAAVTMKPSRILAESKIQCVFARVIPLNRGVTRFNLYEAE